MQKSSSALQFPTDRFDANKKKKYILLIQLQCVCEYQYNRNLDLWLLSFSFLQTLKCALWILLYTLLVE